MSEGHEPDSSHLDDVRSASTDNDLSLDLSEHAPAPEPIEPTGTTTDSPYAPRPVEKSIQLPEAANHDQLQLATAAVVHQGLSISEAAKNFGVDPETLFIWHRSYLNFMGRDIVALGKDGSHARERVEFDEGANRKFDQNWAEMLRIWELERPQLSPMRKRLLASPFTRWMFRGEKVEPVTIAGALAVIAFTALAIRGGTNQLGKDPATSSQHKSASTAPLDPSNPDSLHGDSKDVTLSKLSDALNEFAALETWQERLPFVRKPEQTKPLMAAYYASHADGSLADLIISPQVSFIQRDHAIFALIQGRYTPVDAKFGKPEPVIFLAETNEEDPPFLFDWQVMVNYEPVPWEKFVASRSTEPATFRMKVARGDYYNQPFMDAEKYASYVLQPLHREETAYGFVERGTPLAKQLEGLLNKEMNRTRAMILELKFPANAKYDNITEIESIVSDGWLEE